MSGFGRLSPGGSALPLRIAGALWRAEDPAAGLQAALAGWLGEGRAAFAASGREALRVAFADAAARTGRVEVAMPAYACFSIPAAAVAAGLRVRLVDVDAAGRLDAEAVRALPSGRVAALVACNLFGIAEPIGVARDWAKRDGCRLIDDAAQALGARGADGAAGARGDVGVLSFGRGKPLCGLGGGARWLSADDAGQPARRVGAGDRARASLRALGYDAARQPALLRVLSAVPQLGIGETDYDPEFARGGIDGAALCLAAAAATDFERAAALRAATAEALAARIVAASAFAPLLPPDGARGVFPRLGVLAPDLRAREAALGACFPHGAARFYPTPLGAIRALAPHLAGDAACPGARAFCDRLLTLPTHEGVAPWRIDAIAAAAGRLS